MFVSEQKHLLVLVSFLSAVVFLSVPLSGCTVKLNSLRYVLSRLVHQLLSYDCYRCLICPIRESSWPNVIKIELLWGKTDYTFHHAKSNNLEK